MVTLVGTQNDMLKAIKELVELDYDAVEAYEAAIERLEDQAYKDKMREFKADHQRHIQELSQVLREHEAKFPTKPSGKQWLTKGKVVVANLLGDETILAAMKSNESDTNKAYQRMNDRDDIPDEVKNIIHRGLQDEKKHKAWLEQQLRAS